MRATMSRYLAVLNPERYTLAGKWLMLGATFAVAAALFHPLWLLIGGVVGAFTFALPAWGGFVLGRKCGAVYGALTGLGFIPLWTFEYGFSAPDSISAPLISMVLGVGGGWIREGVLRIQAQAETLKATRLELMQAEKMALFGDVAAGVAHEINQPLAIIGMAAQMAEQELEDGDATEVAGQLSTIREQIKRSQEIVHRLKSTRQSFEEEARQMHDINELVAGVAEQFRHQMQALGVDLEVRPASGLPQLYCQASAVQQVLTYLLLNARDAVSDTPVKRVSVSTAHENGHVAIEVADTGVGMNAATRERIFDPFFTTKELGQGSGLGLSITYRIIRDHGGTIGIDSAPGVGTRIRLLLPQEPAEAPADETPATRAHSAAAVCGEPHADGVG